MSIETLDNDSIDLHNAEMTIPNGSSFSSNARFVSIFIIIVGLVMLISGGPGFVIGPVLLFGALFILTSTHGVDISFSTNYAREYHKRFFVKTGKWVPLTPYSDICVLKIGKTQTVSDITGVARTNLDSSKNEVYLMTFDHRKRFLLKICENQKSAVKFAEEMAEKLGKKFTIYNPQLSEQTKQRLKYRR